MCCYNRGVCIMVACWLYCVACGVGCGGYIENMLKRAFTCVDRIGGVLCG